VTATREVVLYSKPGCHLCDEARAAIEDARPTLPPFRLREIDIRDDEQVFDRYHLDIPVCEVDEKEVFRHRLDPPDLDRLHRMLRA
jgi:glutaredoxin